jgi:hypothetical protein
MAKVGTTHPWSSQVGFGSSFPSFGPNARPTWKTSRLARQPMDGRRDHRAVLGLTTLVSQHFWRVACGVSDGQNDSLHHSSSVTNETEASRDKPTGRHTAQVHRILTYLDLSANLTQVTTVMSNGEQFGSVDVLLLQGDGINVLSPTGGHRRFTTLSRIV